MEMAIAVAILLVALCRLLRAHKESEKMASEYIALGAIVGSIIAALFRKSGRWIFQVFTGSWIGYVSATWLSDYMQWDVSSVDYNLLAGTIMGCLGYSLIELALSPETRSAIRSKLASMGQK